MRLKKMMGIILGIVLVGCSQKPVEEAIEKDIQKPTAISLKENQPIEVSLEFYMEEDEEEDYGSGIPLYTNAYLHVKGETDTRYDLGKFMGSMNEQELGGLQLPKGTQQLYFNWENGFGGYLALAQTKNELDVYYRPTWETEGDKDSGRIRDQVVFEKLVSVKLSLEQPIQFIEHKILDEEPLKKGAYQPIIVNSQLVGGYKDARWYDKAEMIRKIDGNEHYKLYDIEKGYIGEGQGNHNRYNEYERQFLIPISGEKQYMAVGGMWDAMPRVPKIQGNSTYEKLYPHIQITQNYRIDLEGDGEEEVILSGQNDEGRGIVMARKVVNGQVKEFVLMEDLIQGRNGEISGILDLNGDGKMELILAKESIAPRWTVYEWNNQLEMFARVI